MEWLKKDLGFDEAFNYKKVSLRAHLDYVTQPYDIPIQTTVADSLKTAAPNGVDCFFENVGGEDFNVVLNNMNQFGRVAICGFISGYNKMGQMLETRVPTLHPPILRKELKVEGFIVSRWLGPEWFAAIKQMAAWIAEGKIKARETIVEGFEKTPKAFIGLFSGDNTGKMVVKA